MVPVSFGATELLLRSDRAVYWPRERTLFVADLHLEKASFFASHGQPLPPYDSRATLERVARAVEETRAERVVTLGDNFHDAEGASRLEDTACEMLCALTRAVDWVWITGNHDGPSDADEAANRCGGTLHAELEIGGIVCRGYARRIPARAFGTLAPQTGRNGQGPPRPPSLRGHGAKRCGTAHGPARIRHAYRRNGRSRPGDPPRFEPCRHGRSHVRGTRQTGPHSALAKRKTRGLKLSRAANRAMTCDSPFRIAGKSPKYGARISTPQESIP